MIKYRIPIAITALLLSLGLLSSCGGNGGKGAQTEPFVPADPIPEETETEDTTDYGALAALKFSNLTPTDASAFTVEQTENGAVLTSYSGNESKVRIPDCIGDKPVVGIADGVFGGHTEITVLYIPDTVVDFGTNILVGCSQLYALHTPLPTKEGTAFLGYLYGAEIYEKNNMPDLRNLEFLEIGGSITELGAFALYDCNDLVTVSLPDTVKTLGEYSLYRCESLKYLNAEGLTEVKPFALAHCAALTDLSFGSGLREIGLGALEGCLSLRNLVLPFVGGTQNENSYLGYIFGATNPTFSLDFYPNALRKVSILSGCTQLGDYAFYNCQSLRTVVLPEGITTVGLRAFAGCTRLTSLALPDSVTSVREYALAGCISLKSLSLGNSLQTLGVGAFSDCSALTEITLPQSLSALPSSAFSGCARLVRVDFGGVSEVGKQAFYHCDALSEAVAHRALSIAEGNERLETLVRS